MSSNYTDPFRQDTEHYLQRVLAGNVDDVRHRLMIALERLDYDFIDDSDREIHAKRKARGWAQGYASTDVLEYPRTLIIKFKPLSQSLTRASFVYIVDHAWLQRGDKEILTREAETLAALSTMRSLDQNCAVCGAESTSDSRFCRNCGAPMASDETALELLRMSAEARSGHTSVAIGTIFCILIAVANLAALLSLIYSGVTNENVFIFLACGIGLSLLAALSNGFAWKRLNKALKMSDQSAKTPKVFADKMPQAISSSEAAALPPQPAYSVIEDTTRLLTPDERSTDFVDRRTDRKTDTNDTLSE